RCEAKLSGARQDSCVSMPSSSRSSRISAASGLSPSFTLPPGNSHSPAIALPSGRWASSTRPSASTSATATTRMTGRVFIARAIGERGAPRKRHSQSPRNRVKSAAEGIRVRSLTERLVRRVYYKYFARNLLYELQMRARAEAADYAQAHMTDALIFEKPGALLRYCVAAAAPNRAIHGFDSFEGLPEHWSGHLTTRGAFDQRGVLPKVPANVTLHKGWFDATLPAWKAAHPDPIAFLHVDCDIYSSSRFVLVNLADRF